MTNYFPHSTQLLRLKRRDKTTMFPVFPVKFLQRERLDRFQLPPHPCLLTVRVFASPLSSFHREGRSKTVMFLLPHVNSGMRVTRLLLTPHISTAVFPAPHHPCLGTVSVQQCCQHPPSTCFRKAARRRQRSRLCLLRPFLSVPPSSPPPISGLQQSWMAHRLLRSPLADKIFLFFPRQD